MRPDRQSIAACGDRLSLFAAWGNRSLRYSRRLRCSQLALFAACDYPIGIEHGRRPVILHLGAQPIVKFGGLGSVADMHTEIWPEKQ